MDGLTPAQRSVLACLNREWLARRPVHSLEHLCGLLGLRSRGALHRHVEALVEAGWVAPLDRHRLGLRPGPRSLPGVLTLAPSLPTRHSPAGVPPRPEAAIAPAATTAGDPAATRSRAAVPHTELPTAAPRRLRPHAGATDRLQGGTLRALPRLGRIAAGAPLDAVFDEDPVLVPEALAPTGDAYVLEVRGDSMTGDGILDGDLVIVEVDPHVRPGEVAVVLVAGEGATLKRFRHEGGMIRLMASNPAVPDLLVPAGQVVVQGRVSGLMRSYRA